jgi:hypothetical protein
MEKKSQQKNHPGYFRGLGSKTRTAREKHFSKQSKMSWDDPDAYKPAPGDAGKETKVSKWTDIANKRFSEEVETLDESALREIIAEMIESLEDEELDESGPDDELDEAKKKKKKGGSATALKNKAKSANAPLGALRAIYNKGLAAWRTGHRPGAGQHQWAMARVNSVLAGGPARKVDAAQWKRIQKFRKNKRD